MIALEIALRTYLKYISTFYCCSEYDVLSFKTILKKIVFSAYAIVVTKRLQRIGTVCPRSLVKLSQYTIRPELLEQGVAGCSVLEQKMGCLDLVLELPWAELY